MCDTDDETPRTVLVPRCFELGVLKQSWQSVTADRAPHPLARRICLQSLALGRFAEKWVPASQRSTSAMSTALLPTSSRRRRSRQRWLCRLPWIPTTGGTSVLSLLRTAPNYSRTFTWSSSSSATSAWRGTRGRSSSKFWNSSRGGGVGGAGAIIRPPSTSVGISSRSRQGI